MLDTTQLIQQHLGAKPRTQEAYWGLASKGQAGMRHPGKKSVSLSEYFDPTSGHFCHLKDMLRNKRVEPLPCRVTLDGAFCDRKELGYLASRKTQIISKAQKGSLGHALFTDLDQVQRRMNTLG
jgi:hypothetical protein